jgi:alpha-L-fucosidase
MKKIILLTASLWLSFSVKAQYQYPEEPEVLQNLTEWQDLKFGFFIHWGTYSQWGIVESWSLHPGTAEWTWGNRPKNKSYDEYVKDYENLKLYFNPVRFDPERWAVAAREAGMKYVVFTTKHHDGFNMFDTKQTDYKITSEESPFSKHPKANISKEVFKAFAKENFKIGAYYSITDWHNDDCIWKFFPWCGGGVNYDTEKFPERFARFNDFINNQLAEITGGDYGKIDIVWFDGGIQKADWGRIKNTIRAGQPHTLMVGRNQGGLFENYLTPENTIPEEARDYPWETCMPMASWSYRMKPNWRPTRLIIKNLMQIVSRGGNFLLGFGPGPDGDLHPDAYIHLKNIGDWIKINGEAVYATRTIAPYEEGKTVFTQKGDYVYASYLPDEKDSETEAPSEITINSFQPKKGSSVYLLGYSKPLSWKATDKGFVVKLPVALQKNPPCKYAWILKFKV